MRRPRAEGRVLVADVGGADVAAGRVLADGERVQPGARLQQELRPRHRLVQHDAPAQPALDAQLAGGELLRRILLRRRVGPERLVDGGADAEPAEDAARLAPRARQRRRASHRRACRRRRPRRTWAATRDRSRTSDRSRWGRPRDRSRAPSAAGRSGAGFGDRRCGRPERRRALRRRAEWPAALPRRRRAPLRAPPARALAPAPSAGRFRRRVGVVGGVAAGACACARASSVLAGGSASAFTSESKASFTSFVRSSSTLVRHARDLERVAQPIAHLAGLAVAHADRQLPVPPVALDDAGDHDPGPDVVRHRGDVLGRVAGREQLARRLGPRGLRHDRRLFAAACARPSPRPSVPSARVNGTHRQGRLVGRRLRARARREHGSDDDRDCPKARQQRLSYRLRSSSSGMSAASRGAPGADGGAFCPSPCCCTASPALDTPRNWSAKSSGVVDEASAVS